MAGDPKPSPKRHLPVLNDKPPASARGEHDPGDPLAEERAPWRWVALGIVATFLVWLPVEVLVGTLVQPLVARSEEDGAPGSLRLWIVAAHTLAYAVGTFAGGVLVGRLGGKAGRREAAVAGAGAGVLAWVLTMSLGMPGSALTKGLMLALIALIGAGGGVLGGALGVRWRPRAT